MVAFCWVSSLPRDEGPGPVSQLAAALQFLHEQGLLHGDLRPDHVLLYTHQEEVRPGFAAGTRRWAVLARLEVCNRDLQS